MGDLLTNPVDSAGHQLSPGDGGHCQDILEMVPESVHRSDWQVGTAPS